MLIGKKSNSEQGVLIMNTQKIQIQPNYSHQAAAITNVKNCDEYVGAKF